MVTSKSGLSALKLLSKLINCRRGSHVVFPSASLDGDFEQWNVTFIPGVRPFTYSAHTNTQWVTCGVTPVQAKTNLR